MGECTDDGKVDAFDILETRSHPHPFFNPSVINSQYDFNRDQRVDAIDTLIARENQTWAMTELYLFPGKLQVLITEAGTGTPDSIEIQNVSTGTVDTSGWVVAANNARGYEINDVHLPLWTLSGTMEPEDLAYRADTTGDNIYWRNASDGWVLMVDDSGQVVDFVVWGYDDLELASLHVDIGGYSGNPAVDAWQGSAVSSEGAAFLGLQRIGNTDQDNALDWTFEYEESPDETNDGLILPFPSSGGGVPGNNLTANQRVDAIDTLIARENQTWAMTELELIDLSGVKSSKHVGWDEVPPSGLAKEVPPFDAEKVGLRCATSGPTAIARPIVLDWLYALEESSQRDRPSQNRNSVESAVDMLLADSWVD